MKFAEKMKTIVVATDLAGQSDGALEYARKLAGAYGARVILAHGLDPMEYAEVGSVPGAVRRDLPAAAREVLDQMAADLIADGIHSHSEARQGTMVELLLDAAQQYDAGLIVIGTRGRSGAGPVAVGSIAEQLVRRAPCAVLAVAADWNAGEFRPEPGGPVMLALERNDAAEAAVEAASSLAETFHRTLIVVHARTAAEASAFLNPRESTPEQLGVRKNGAFAVRCIVKDGNPAEAIARAVIQHSPSILVLGVKRRSRAQGASGSGGPHSTAFAVLAGSWAPVLCVPADAVAAQGEVEHKHAMEIG